MPCQWHVRVHYARHLRLASMDGERSRFCPEDRDDELEEYHLRAAERNLSWDATLKESVNWKGRSPSRWIGIWFASLESERPRLRLLPLELESESESESEEEEALSDLESESELDDPYEARTCQNFARSTRIYTDCAHWTSSSPCPYPQSPTFPFPSSQLVRVRAPCP